MNIQIELQEPKISKENKQNTKKQKCSMDCKNQKKSKDSA